MPPVVGPGGGFLRLGSGSGRGVLLGPWPRRPDAKAHAFLSATPIPLGAFPLAEPAVAMPAPGGCILRPPRLLDEQGPRGGLRAPGGAGLAEGPGTRDSGASNALGLEP
jgi:hypothetical protein